MSEKTLWDAMHQVGYVCGIIGNFKEGELKSVRDWCQWRLDHDFTKPEPPIVYGEGMK